MFKNREEAATELVTSLERYKGLHPLIIGIPRGAMPMAKIIATELGGDLNAVLVHKIPSPTNEEFAIGSIGISGQIYLSPTVNELHISKDYLKKTCAEQLRKLKARQKQWHLPELQCKDRVIILVDDGIATGATVMAAIQELRSQKPQKIILATAVIPKQLVAEIRSSVDDLVTLKEADDFFSVSQFFTDFSQVTDDQVTEIIQSITPNVLSLDHNKNASSQDRIKAVKRPFHF